MSAQSLLWQASKQSVNIRLNDKGGLRLFPVNRATKELAPFVKQHKTELLPLIAELERYECAGDLIILEALALFNARISGLQPAIIRPRPAEKHTQMALWGGECRSQPVNRTRSKDLHRNGRR
jgi:hypothetical protein